jgi:hypothetical protein
VYLAVEASSRSESSRRSRRPSRHTTPTRAEPQLLVRRAPRVRSRLIHPSPMRLISSSLRPERRIAALACALGLDPSRIRSSRSRPVCKSAGCHAFYVVNQVAPGAGVREGLDDGLLFNLRILSKTATSSFAASHWVRRSTIVRPSSSMVDSCGVREPVDSPIRWRSFRVARERTSACASDASMFVKSPAALRVRVGGRGCGRGSA